jgi:hypothetical protein
MQMISMVARSLVAYPLVAIGLILTKIAEYFIRTAGWLVDAKLDTK